LSITAIRLEESCSDQSSQERENINGETADAT
jgi:hypothetical protein